MKTINRYGFIMSILVALCSCAPLSPRLIDGAYYGYEFTCNLSQSEDPEASWYYANVLHIDQGSVSLTKSPRYISKGSVIASVSDGGFPSFDGMVEQLEKRTLVRLRKVSCDYCVIPLDDPLPSKIEREYVLRFINDGSFELDGVIYRVSCAEESETGVIVIVCEPTCASTATRQEAARQPRVIREEVS